MTSTMIEHVPCGGTGINGFCARCGSIVDGTNAVCRQTYPQFAVTTYPRGQEPTTIPLDQLKALLRQHGIEVVE